VRAAAAVIANLDGGAVVPNGDAHRHPTGLRVLRGIGERLGDYEVRGHLGASRHALGRHGQIRIHPLFVGKGSTDDVLFPKGRPTQFELTDATILKNSMAILTYRPA
jgi:hypothetical protein